MWKRFFTLAIFGFVSLFVFTHYPVLADRLEDLQTQINDLQAKVSTSKAQQKTLSSQLDLINNQISLTSLQIQSTQGKLDRLNSDISSVSGKIDRLEGSLEQTSNVLANRIVQTYIAGRTDPVFYLLISSDFSDLLARLDYLRIVQKHDKTLMYQMAAIKKNYHDQKDILEDKRKEVELLNNQLKSYQVKLDTQKSEKQNLLSVTQNDEKKYQQLLSDAQREIDAIRNSQFSGKRAVKRGDVIGLMGSTGFSTGPHLHFGVYNVSEDQADKFVYGQNSFNPLDYLQNRTIMVESGACNDKVGSATVGGGSFSWPLSHPEITQCYGRTPYSFVYANGMHDGLDLWQNSDIEVRSVDDGNAYFFRGSSSFGNNVRIFHSNGKMTLYLHLQ